MIQLGFLGFIQGNYLDIFDNFWGPRQRAQCSYEPWAFAIVYVTRKGS